MARPWKDLFFGGASPRELLDVVVPRRTFADVVLPASTRRALENALAQIRKHDLIFREWGLSERHDTGLGLAFNFAGPPGTGKTICAEAIAQALGRNLLVVRYAELESQWAGATAKNVAAVFRTAAETDSVLFFDEADAIAGRRFTSVDQGYQREANAVVNVLLRELESFSGVVIFATNLAANFDPAFERRIRTHILFAMPGVEDRERIWRAQLHARKTPLGPDVDFGALAEEFPVSGGDIKNAVIKAAQRAVSEPGPDAEKRITQLHFEEGMREVLDAKRVMDQSLFDGTGPGAEMLAPLGQLSGAQEALEESVGDLADRLREVEDSVEPVTAEVQRLESEHEALQRQLAQVLENLEGYRESAERAEALVEQQWKRRGVPLMIAALLALLLAAAALAILLL